MDPTACWLSLVEAYTTDEESWERIEELAQDLLCWLEKGGFPPTFTGNQEFDRLVVKATCEAILAWEVA